MITKLCVVCLCMTASSMIGVWHMKRKRSRVHYFESLVKLCDMLASEVSFRKGALIGALKDFSDNDASELSPQIREICSSPYSEIAVHTLFLKPHERKLVKEFFDSLGSTDTSTQLLELDSYKRKFAEIYACESEKFAKTGSVGLKLSVLFGLAVGILIL